MKKNYLMLLIKVLGLMCIISTTLQANTNLPKGYYEYRDTLYKEVNIIIPDFLIPPYFGGLIEHESCITLVHSKCWNPKSRLKTSREEGAGLPQLTRAYHSNGTIRFDTLTELVKKHPKDLKGLSWATVYDRADLQIRAMLLLWKSNYNLFLNKNIDYWNIIAFSDSAYNGGYGHVYKDMQICKMKSGCDPRIWFGNVEKYSVKSKDKLYGNRSAYDINRHHVNDVLNNRLPKYIDDWANSGMYKKYPVVE